MRGRRLLASVLDAKTHNKLFRQSSSAQFSGRVASPAQDELSVTNDLPNVVAGGFQWLAVAVFRTDSRRVCQGLGVMLRSKRTLQTYIVVPATLMPAVLRWPE